MYRAVVSIVVLAAAKPATAGGFGIPEIGVRRTAMATSIGRPDEPSAIYHNPAGLVLQSGWNLYASMGLSLLATEFRLQPWEGSERFLDATPDAEGYYPTITPTRALGVIPMVAATFAIKPDKLVVGGAIYVGNATGARFANDSVARYHLIDGYIVAPQAMASAAYRVLPSLTVGASLGAVNLRVHGRREVFPVINGTDLSSITGSHAMLELDGEAWAPSWLVGAFGQPHRRVTWGATITGRVDAELTGPIKVTFSDDAGTPGDMLIGAQRTQQMLPWAAMAGVNVDATDQLEVAGDFRYWLYRQYENQHTDIKGIALLRELDTPKNYRDSWQASLGARIHSLAAIPRLDVMVGGHFDRTPAPPQTVTLDQPSFSHWGAHLGARYQTGRYRIGASFIHYWYLIPTITDSITGPPSNIRGTGGNNIITVSMEAKL